MTEAQKGVAAVVGAATIWGFATLYYKAMAHVPPLEVLAHRSLWTMVFFGLWLALYGRLAEVWALIIGPQGKWVAVASAIVLVNWGLFIWAIQAGHAVQASLGYYILPLVMVGLGVMFGERLTRWQGIAVSLAALAVAVLTWGQGGIPWVALSLAFSFAPYMLIKKRMEAPAIISVMAEVVLISPFAMIWLLGAAMGRVEGGYFGADLFSTLLLPIAGLLTGGPLVLFSWGAKRVRLATLGLVQYLNPTLQAISAVVIFAEPFTRWHVAAFAMIWGALALYSWETWRQDRAARSAADRVGTSGTTE